MSVVSIIEETDHVITAPQCMLRMDISLKISSVWTVDENIIIHGGEMTDT